MTEYFTITRELAAPREMVFTAITQPEHFAVWFGTAAVQVPQESLVMDVRVGGEFRAVMLLPDGNQIHWAGEYVNVDPPARVAMTLTDNPGETSGLPVVFTIEETPTGATLQIRQARADFTDEQVEATINGYNLFIDDIVNELARMQSR